MDWKARLKNPYFWCGLAGIILAAAGIEPSTLTSWGAVGAALIGIAQNLFVLGGVVLAVLGVVVDPSTKGISDSKKE